LAPAIGYGADVESLNGMKTALVPNTGSAIQLIKLISAVIIADAHNCCGATSKCELLDLKWVVIFPLAEKLFQFSLISDPDPCPNRKISFIRSIRLAHEIRTLTRTRSATPTEDERGSEVECFSHLKSSTNDG
jgi:hypothetical protein